MTLRNLYRRADAIPGEPIGPQADYAHYRSAEAASKALRRECEQLFWRFAKRHRITPEEARVLIVGTGTAI